MPQLHMPLQSGLGPGAQGDAPVLPPGALPRHHRPGARRDARTPRSPPTSSSASPARPRRTSRRRWTSCARRGSPARSPSSTPSAPAPRPRRCADQVPKAVVQERYERLVELVNEIAWAENQRLEGQHRRADGRRGRGPQGRQHPPALRSRPRQPAGALRPRRRRTVGRSTSRPGDMVEVVVTYAAPHHLVADGPVMSVRRTRAGDAWERRHRRRRRAGVSLGLPTVGVPAPLPDSACLRLMSSPARVVSGGQTGVDRAALESARRAGIPVGGWCPAAAVAEDLAEPPGVRALSRTERDAVCRPVAAHRVERARQRRDPGLVRDGVDSPARRSRSRSPRRSRRPRLVVERPRRGDAPGWLDAARRGRRLDVAGLARVAPASGRRPAPCDGGLGRLGRLAGPAGSVGSVGRPRPRSGCVGRPGARGDVVLPSGSFRACSAGGTGGDRSPCSGDCVDTSRPCCPVRTGRSWLRHVHRRSRVARLSFSAIVPREPDGWSVASWSTFTWSHGACRTCRLPDRSPWVPN